MNTLFVHGLMVGLGIAIIAVGVVVTHFREQKTDGVVTFTEDPNEHARILWRFVLVGLAVVVVFGLSAFSQYYEADGLAYTAKLAEGIRRMRGGN